MNNFENNLKVELIGDQLFRLTDSSKYSNKKFEIKIYKDFEFDGASIPKTLWSIYGCPFGGLYSQAACLHDALYATHLFDRKTCDKIFHEAMLASGVNMNIAKQMYLAVRTFGQSAYDGKYELGKNREFVQINLKGE